MAKRILYFFDKLEARMRGRLSHHPIIYAVVGGVGIVLFWRGVWLTADVISEILIACSPAGCSTMSRITIAWWDGPLSLLVGVVILLSTGVFVSNFIGNEIIIAGLRGEKKLSEKTEKEERMEVGAIGEIRAEVKKIMERLDELDGKSEKS